MSAPFTLRVAFFATSAVPFVTVIAGKVQVPFFTVNVPVSLPEPIATDAASTEPLSPSKVSALPLFKVNAFLPAIAKDSETATVPLLKTTASSLPTVKPLNANATLFLLTSALAPANWA